jgi:hypothetical protein
MRGWQKLRLELVVKISRERKRGGQQDERKENIG